MISKKIVSFLMAVLVNGFIFADPVELAPVNNHGTHSYRELLDSYAVAWQPASTDEKESAFLSAKELQALEEAAKAEIGQEIKKIKDKKGKDSTLERKKQELKAITLKAKDDQTRLVYEVFAQTPDLPEIVPAKKASIQSSSFVDGKFFLGDPDSTLNSIHGILFGPEFTRTLSGRAIAAIKLANPCCQAADIIANQKRAKFFIENPQNFEQIDNVLEQIGSSEQAWFRVSLRKTRSDFLSELAQPNDKSKPNRKQLLQSKKYFNSEDWTWDPKKGNLLTRPARNIMDKLARSSEVGTFLLGNSSFSMSGLKLLFIFGSPFLSHKFKKFLERKGLQYRKESLETLLQANPSNQYYTDLISNINETLKELENAPGLFKKGWDLAKEVPGLIKGVPGFVNGLNEIRKANSKMFWLSAGGVSLGFAPLFYTGYLAISSIISNYLNIHNTISGILEAQKTLCEMRKLKDQMRTLCTMVDQDTFPEIAHLKKFVDCKTLDAELNHLLAQLDSWTFKSNPSLFSRHGRTIQAFIALEKLKERFAPAMKIVGQIDCTMAIVKNIKKTEGLANGFCFPEIIQSDQTIFEVDGMWNLFVGPEISIPNDLCLGAGSQHGKYGAAISGPNFGGKSVYLLGTFTLAALVQSFGIGPAKVMKFTPFDGFVTYVKVNDNPPTDSLFSAQCRRMRELFDLATQSKEEGKKVLIIADELLTGTKVTFAESLVRSAIREFSSLGGCVYLIATHFDAVTENLEKDSGGKFENLQVLANLDPQGFFDSPKFKVGQGISHADAAFKVAASRFGEKYQHVIDNAKPLVLEEINKKIKTRANA